MKDSISQLVPQTKHTEQSYQTCPWNGAGKMQDVKMQYHLHQTVTGVIAILSSQKHLDTDWNSPNDPGHCQHFLMVSASS